MAKEFEVDPDLDAELEVLGEEEFSESGEFLELEDYLAMGIDPTQATRARPGSEEKVLMLSARYAAGLPLWHDRDCYDHGPRETELMGLAGGFEAAAALVGAEEELEEEDA
jgi:hypothetical protein